MQVVSGRAGYESTHSMIHEFTDDFAELNWMTDSACPSNTPDQSTLEAKGSGPSGRRLRPSSRPTPRLRYSLSGTRATRKPREMRRSHGPSLKRLAERQNAAPLPQLPPRFTRPEPSKGPKGF